MPQGPLASLRSLPVVRLLRYTLPDYGSFLAVSAPATWILYELSLDLLKRGGWVAGSWGSLLLPSVLSVLPLFVALHGERRGWLDAYREVAESARGFRSSLLLLAAALAFVAFMNHHDGWVPRLDRAGLHIPGSERWGTVSRLPWTVGVFYAGLWLVDMSYLWAAFRPGESPRLAAERLAAAGIRRLEFRLRNRGPGVVTVRAESRSAWLSVEPAEATLFRERKQAFRVTVREKERPQGEAGAIRIWAPGTSFDERVRVEPKRR